MGWMTMRRATDEDHRRLAFAAARFCRRHQIADAPSGRQFPPLARADGSQPSEVARVATQQPERAVAWATDPSTEPTLLGQEQARYLRSLWRQVVRRQLGHRRAEGIQHGYVGYEHD